MSYDSIARAAEHYWDSRQEAAEREAERQDAMEEALAERAEAQRNDALSTIREQLANPEIAKSFAMQLLNTMGATICDHFTDGPMDQIHSVLFDAIEALEAQGVAA